MDQLIYHRVKLVIDHKLTLAISLRVPTRDRWTRIRARDLDPSDTDSDMDSDLRFGNAYTSPLVANQLKI